MTNEEIKAEMIEACEEFQAEGYRLVYGSYCDYEDAPCGGCVLAAVAYVHGGIEPEPGEDGSAERIVAFARARYGWNDSEGDAFVDGYDAITRWGVDQKHSLYELGRAVHDAVNPAEAGTL